MKSILKEPILGLYTNVRILCETRSLSIAELERLAGLGNGVVRKWNVSSPTLRNVMAVENCLGVTLEELLPAKYRR